MKKILLIEDDQTIALGIKTYLEKNGFNLIVQTSLEKAKICLLNEKEIELILLDLNLPDGTGYELCEFVRKREPTPIIFLTVCDEEEQIVKGFDLGADDYITKPFKLSILLSRIQAVLRRTQGIGSRQTKNEKKAKFLYCNNISIDQQKKYVYLNEQRIDLSAGEYRLLHILLTYKNYTLTRQQLLEKLWDENEQFVNDNTLTVTMKRLREKLGHPSFIKTIRGIGYLVEEED
ncbi:MAG: response regulator transcription factor [Cellulosilyticum sp.]|nr:response regulator transcription factor [Cellulosilyticum sp.]